MLDNITRAENRGQMNLLHASCPSGCLQRAPNQRREARMTPGSGELDLALAVNRCELAIVESVSAC